MVIELCDEYPRYVESNAVCPLVFSKKLSKYSIYIYIEYFDNFWKKPMDIYIYIFSFSFLNLCTTFHLTSTRIRLTFATIILCCWKNDWGTHASLVSCRCCSTLLTPAKIVDKEFSLLIKESTIIEICMRGLRHLYDSCMIGLRLCLFLSWKLICFVCYLFHI